eukprot:gene7239-9695_t
MTQLWQSTWSSCPFEAGHINSIDEGVSANDEHLKRLIRS